MKGLLFADILIVDDRAESSRQLRTVLQSAGYTVRRFTSDQDIPGIVRRHPPDLLLLAKDLLRGDGCTLARTLKREETLPFFPLLMLIPENNRALKAEVMNAGADEFVVRPVDNAELLIRVRALLRLQRTHEALAELNATLEAKVEERTAKLEQAHEKLRHGEKLTALGRFAASITHDINNPLTGILTYLYILKRKPPDGEKLLRDLDLIEKQVLVITELVENLQNFARPPRTEREPVHLSDVVESVLALVDKELAQQDITVQCTCDPSTPPVLASPGQMQEIFMNLIMNARDAMSSGGDLVVHVGPWNGVVRLVVRDTGMGIAPDIRTRIFEPFFTTKGEEGTGLGLSICYSIVKEHGGDINVDSEPGRGTEFEVCLPAMQMSAA